MSLFLSLNLTRAMTFTNISELDRSTIYTYIFALDCVFLHLYLVK